MARFESSETVRIPREEIQRLLAEDAAHAGQIRCPACAPLGWQGACDCCRDTRFVSKATFAAFHSRCEGRPSLVPLDSYEEKKP